MPPDPATLRRLRRALIAALALGTTLLAFTLVVHALSPQRLGLAPTSQLVAILALLTLPACTIAAWAWDRSLRLRLAHPEDDETPARAREHPAGRTRPHASPQREQAAQQPTSLNQH